MNEKEAELLEALTKRLDELQTQAGYWKRRQIMKQERYMKYYQSLSNDDKPVFRIGHPESKFGFLELTFPQIMKLIGLVSTVLGGIYVLLTSGSTILFTLQNYWPLK